MVTTTEFYKNALRC